MEQEIAALQKVYAVIAEFIVSYSFQILGAIILLLIGTKVAGSLSRAVSRLCDKKRLDATLSRFLASTVKILTLAFVIIIALGKFGISIAPFIAALGALAFGSSMAIQGPLSNYGAGLSIILTRPFVIGNTITVKGVSGVVDEIRLAATILSTEDGECITIPNKHIVGEILHNSYENKVVETTVGISYGDDPQIAVRAVQKALLQVEEVCRQPAAQIGIEAFGDSAIEIGLRYWVPTKKYFQTLYQVNLAVHLALAEADIIIPFPQLDVNLIEQSQQSQRPDDGPGNQL